MEGRLAFLTEAELHFHFALNIAFLPGNIEAQQVTRMLHLARFIWMGCMVPARR